MINIIQIFRLVLFVLFLQIEACLEIIPESNNYIFNFQESTKDTLPTKYHYLSDMYHILKGSSEKNNIVSMLQLYDTMSKKYHVPPEIINTIFRITIGNYCVFSKLEISPNIPSQYKDVFKHFTVTSLKREQGRMTIEKLISINLKENSTLENLIQEFKDNSVNFDETTFRNKNRIKNDTISITKPINMNVDGETYDLFFKKTRDYYIYIDNNLRDQNHAIIGSTTRITNLKSNEKKTIKFSDRIVLNADVSENGILAVETIDEKIYSNEYGDGDSHFHNTDYPEKHAIEIYDFFTDKLLNKIKLPLPKEYRFGHVLFSLCQITDQNIYIFDLENKKYITITYLNDSLLKITPKPTQDLSLCKSDENNILSINPEQNNSSTEPVQNPESTNNSDKSSLTKSFKTDNNNPPQKNNSSHYLLNKIKSSITYLIQKSIFILPALLFFYFFKKNSHIIAQSFIIAK